MTEERSMNLNRVIQIIQCEKQRKCIWGKKLTESQGPSE